MSAARIDEPWLNLERIAFSDLGAMLFAAKASAPAMR